MVYVAADNIITSLGFSSEENFRNLKNNTSGIQINSDTTLSNTPFPVSLINTSKLDEEFAQIGIKITNEFTRLEKLFTISISKAISDLAFDYTTPRTLLILSTTKGNIELLDENLSYNFAPEQKFLWGIGDILKKHFGFYHSPVIVSNACISGLSAIIMAQRFIAAGEYDTIVVSGGDILSRFVISGFQSFQAISPQPCKPFDIERQGINLGEGCGTIILTNDVKIVKDNSKVIVSGGANTNDANHISGPSRNGDGLYIAIQRALKISNTNAKTIGYISAHGTGTNYNDEMETKAIAWAGMEQIPVNSMKAYIGHTLGAAGVIESIIGIHSLKNNLLVKSLGYDNLGVSVPINIIQTNVTKNFDTFLKMASGFGGCNAAALFKILN